MASIYTIEINGHHLDIQANSPDEAMAAANGWAAQQKHSAKDVAYDVAASGAAGLGEGTASTFGALGDLKGAAGGAADYLGGKAGLDPATVDKLKSYFGKGGEAYGSIYAPAATLAAKYAPTSQDIQNRIEGVTGQFHQPETTPGQYARAAGAAIPAAMFGPESLGVKVGTGVGAGLGGEFLASKFEGTPYEGFARALGNIVGGVGAAGGSRGIEAARNYGVARQTGREVGAALGTEPVGAGAVRRLAQSAADDNLTAGGVAARRAELGPEAMLMDMGRQMQGRAEAVALPLGKAQNTVLSAVEGRTGEYGSGARSRIAATLDQELGPSRDVVQLRDDVHNIVQQYATPAYERVMSNHPVVMDDTLARLAERPAIAQAMQRARGVAANYGETIDGAQPSLRYWDFVKKSIDQRISGMMKTGFDDLSSAEKADLGGLMNAKQALVQHLDRVTGGEYAGARRIAATRPELDEALDFGRSIFNSRLLPEEVTQHIGDMSLPAQAMAQVGARREIERVLDAARNDGAAGRRFLDTNNNQQKIASLFGDRAAQAIERRISAENSFQESTQTIARNSRTATRQEAVKDTETPSPGRLDTTLTGLAMKPFRASLAYALMNGMENTRSQMAGALTARGDAISRIADALMSHNQQTARNAPSGYRDYLSVLARELMMGNHQEKRR